MKFDLKIFDVCMCDYLFVYVIIGSVGFDLCVCFDVLVMLQLGEIMFVLMGFVIYFVDFGYVVLILLCLGFGYKYGIVFGNFVGLIDFDYQGQLMVLIWNCGQIEFVLNLFECFVQFVIVLVVQVQFNIVDEFIESDCGEGGFGSIGCY